MAPEACSWSDSDIFFFLDYLYSSISRIGDGSTSRKEVLSEVCEKLNAPGVRTHVGLKTREACASKLQYFHGLYRIILKIKEASGWAWSNEYGANISPELTSSWDEFVKAHPKAKQF
ncbi:hypothetical protein BDQ17DRAFT_1436258 [Cyathus striatus]|nr:hypothetical protein BDQ17DRAFT_1436258 [Cyathus striatus]